MMHRSCTGNQQNGMKVTDLEVDDGPCRKMMMSNDDLTNLNTPLQ